MARPLRIQYPGAWYHVMNRGRRREKIFLTKKDYTAYLDVLGKSLDFFEFEVHAYSLMPNHYHLLVKTPRGNLARAMRHVDGVYTQQFNREHKHDGPLFRGRYKSMLVEADNYLKELVRYIHRNPFEAGLERKLGEHEWTSHRYYLRNEGRPIWLQRESVLRYFSSRVKEATRKLDAFVSLEPPNEIKSRLNSMKWPVVLGGDAFKGLVRERFLGKRIDEKDIP